MAHSLSAQKRERQNATRSLYNRLNRNVLKKELKAFDKTLKDTPAQAPEALSKIYSALDIAVRKHAIPKGRADRKKARLAQALQKITKRAS